MNKGDMVRENKRLRRYARILPLLAGAFAPSSCELIGRRAEKHPTRWPPSKPAQDAETGVPEAVGDSAATTARMAEAELFAARAAQVGTPPKKKPGPAE